MEPEAIHAFIKNTDTLAKGLSCFRRDRVEDFIAKDGLIEASVSNSGRKPYRVQIRLDDTGNPKAAFCTCLYAAGGFMKCEHIAAVLLYDYETHKSVSNPIKEALEKSEDRVIDLKRSREAPGGTFDVAGFLTRVTGLPKETAGKRFALVFVIEQSRENYHPQWVVRPAVRYVRTSGEGGRFERFKAELVTEPFGKTEKELLYRLGGGETPAEGLEMHLDFLVDKGVSSLYLKENVYNYFPVRFKEIRSVHAGFDIGLVKGDSVFFTPVVRFVGDEGHLTLTRETAFRCVKSGFSFYAFGGDGTLYYRRGDEAGADLLEVLLKRKNFYTYRDISRLKGFFPDKGGAVEIGSVQSELKILDRVPRPFVELEGNWGSVSLTLWFDYEGIEVPLSEEGEFVVRKEANGSRTLIRRKRGFERKVAEFIRNRFKPVHQRDFYSGALTARVGQREFLVAHGREILDEGIEIRLMGARRAVSASRGKVAVRVESGIDWLEVKAGYQDEGGDLRNIEIDPSLLSSGLLKAGDSYIILTERDLKKLNALLDEGMSETGDLKLSRYRFHFIDEFYSVIVNRQDPAIERIRELNRRLKDFTAVAGREPPARLNGTLRDYQRAGYEWLFFLREFGLSGCLADDMGLGKTVQVLALLQRLKEEGKLKTSLVLVPVNTISNWESEIRRFTPGLEYLLHYGAGRKEALDRLDRFDFILSSYHTLRNDLALFKDMDFDYLILDESQQIKNSNSLAFKAVRTLKAAHRLALTGTPVENSTMDLWAQMEFLNPGILGTRKHFTRGFAKPIETRGDKAAAEKLRKITRPFLLRRKKEDVLKELPEKSEIVVYSNMGERQAAVYEQHRQFYRGAVLKKIERDGIERSAIVILSALLKLRQAALFPSLADPKFKTIESCKFEQMREMVEELLQEKHKVVVFSQFVRCLEIIGSYFRVRGIDHTYIDGSVGAKQRMEEIERFQGSDELRVFLISLKAGGVGINLTAADYVILFDPWWNPAVESQAVDRLHRIGQKNKVIAYKMVVKNTVEEKILELQERKKTLVSELVTTERGFYKSLSKEDLAGLFER
jgi:superfamily II DNA or RNA helicase